MACSVAQHFADPLPINDISRSVRLHPGYATTLFQKTFGMTLLECVNHDRIVHAQRLLATTDKKILTIALESGFGSGCQDFQSRNVMELAICADPGTRGYLNTRGSA